MYLDDHRTALYRFFDADGALLYVGITHDIEQRWAAHERDKPWWPQVAERPVEWFESRRLALQAELKAIREEAPVHNVTGKSWAETRRELAEDERTVAQVRANLTEFCQVARYTGQVTFIVDTTKKRSRVAVLVSSDFYRQAKAALAARPA